MPRTCTICAHPEREAIEKALIAGDLSYREITGQFNVSKSALSRHKSDHLPAILSKAKEAAEVARADTLLEDMRKLQRITLGILSKAGNAGELRTALQAIGQARQNIELLARMLGELQDQAAVNVLVVSPEWLQTRTSILQALDPFPDARLAVAEALDGNNQRPENST